MKDPLNKLENPSLETDDSDARAWHADGSNDFTAGWSRSNENPRSGLWSLKAVPACNNLYLYNGPMQPTHPGETSFLRSWAVASASGAALGVLHSGVEWLDSSQAVLSRSEVVTASGAAPTAYSRKYTSVTAPANTAFSRFYLRLTSFTSGSWYVDDSFWGDAIPGEMIDPDSDVVFDTIQTNTIEVANEVFTDGLTATGSVSLLDIVNAPQLVSSQAAATAADDTDYVLIHDTSAGVTHKMTRANFLAGMQAALGFTPENVANKDTDTTLSANSDTKYASQKAIKAYVDGLLAASDAVVYKGVIDASASPNYPAASAGHLYFISVAGKIGGASGTSVEVGDMLVCRVDGSAAGTQAAVGANWNVIQTNLVGAVTGPTSAVDSQFASFNGTTGQIIKDSGVSLDTGTGLGTSNVKVPSQGAVKSYVDTQVATKQDADSDLTALAGVSSNGLLARTGSGTAAARTITGTTNRITVTNGDGASGNPTLDVGSDVVVLTGAQTLTGQKKFDDAQGKVGGTSTYGGVPAALYGSITSTNNTTTGETDLINITLPANLFSADKQTLSWEIAGTLAANANNKRWRLYVAGVLVFDSGNLTHNNADWIMRVTMTRGSSTALRLDVQLNCNGQSVIVDWTFENTAFNATNTNVFKLTGTAVATNDMVMRNYRGIWYPAPAL